MFIEFPFEGFIFPDKYGINQSKDKLIDGINLCSLPFQVTNLAATTQTVAFSLIDYDAIPVVGYPWIHWLGANVPVERRLGNRVVIPADASRQSAFLQGTNSMANIIDQINKPADFAYDLTQHYTGPRPRQGAHNYRLDVYGLKSTLPLQPGFGYNQFLEALDTGLVEQAHAYLTYAPKN
ncbi:YbhB/YbcL family Raf kinase inhibitor-like protein [Levilactobacillus cerevisiae]|uniref:YbhB/YbcL family Raf kinase inhibitor-like protein n=1 Tax=Levilactobacillus cerevisiae TaxID=1704076 RepID=UPI000F798068|nr:YbhB/YbcL family Raf kinase inhibitor-like protein [Levilactobacillus cerevisiae]